MMAALLSIALIGLCCFASYPQAAEPPTFPGKLDDEIWKSAVVLRDFYEVQPGDNLIPQNSTEVMPGYDARFLFKPPSQSFG